MAAAKARYAQAASAFAPISAQNLAPQMQLFVEKCEGLYGIYTMPPSYASPPCLYCLYISYVSPPCLCLPTYAY